MCKNIRSKGLFILFLDLFCEYFALIKKNSKDIYENFKQVFGTHDDSTEAEKTVEDIEETQTAAKTDQPPDQQYSDQETGPTNPETAEQSEDKSVPKSGHENLLTDVYQINVSGDQVHVMNT